MLLTYLLDDRSSRNLKFNYITIVENHEIVNCNRVSYFLKSEMLKKIPHIKIFKFDR